MSKNCTFLFFWLVVGMWSVLFSQEIKIFTTDDFDLRGKVKSCLVSTDYGKEEYDFDKQGRLIKSVTRYNDQDYDITSYKYSHGELIEKRVENYREDVFDPHTSIANFYELDSTPPRKVTEKIITYGKKFLERNEYIYDNKNQLTKIVRTDTEGVDETLVETDTVQGETTKTYSLNGVVQKTIRTSERKTANDPVQRVVLTKKYLGGVPNTATENIFDANGQLVSSTQYLYNPKEEQLVPEKNVAYAYDESGTLMRTVAQAGHRITTKTYIYQFDGRSDGNWIKQIITPDNTYATRKITYYAETPKTETLPKEGVAPKEAVEAKE